MCACECMRARVCVCVWYRGQPEERFRECEFPMLLWLERALLCVVACTSRDRHVFTCLQLCAEAAFVQGWGCVYSWFL